MKLSLLGTKSVGGALLGVFGFLARPDVLAILPNKAASIIAGVGALVSVFGLRDAIDKASGGRT